jgi:hypothetical protein
MLVPTPRVALAAYGERQRRPFRVLLGVFANRPRLVAVEPIGPVTHCSQVSRAGRIEWTGEVGRHITLVACPPQLGIFPI